MGVHKKYNTITGKWELDGWGVHWVFDTEKEADDNFKKATDICFRALEARRSFINYLNSLF